MMIKPVAVAIAVCLLASNAAAVELIPRKQGWGGFINLGVGATEVKNSMVATLLSGYIDVGPEVIDDLGSAAERESFALPVVAGELSYVFNDSNTQIYLGNRLEDYVRFDFTARAGIRHNIDGVGILGVSALKSPVINSLEVWQDPYQTGVKRETVDRESVGARLIWEGIMGTEFEFRISSREIDIDKERSGQGLGLSMADQKLLDRNGDINQADLKYALRVNEEHGILMGFVFTDNDLDGKAMSNDGYAFSGTHQWTMASGSRLISNFVYGSFEYDEENPIYGVTDEFDRLAVSVTYFRPAPFGIKHWVLNAGVVYAEDDHDIDFYNSEISSVSVGMLRRF
jgi:hypothetical protein